MLGGWLLATGIAFAGGDELVLTPGGTVESIGPGPIVRYVADRDGPVTIALDSFEMDAFLCVTDASGTLVAAADDGGIRQNARVVVDLRAAETVWIECTTMNVNRWSGRFTLSARVGDVPPPTGPQRDAIEGEFYRAYAGRYLVKGDPVRAAESLAFAAKQLLSGGRVADARAMAHEALRAASLVGRFDIARDVTTIASLAAERLGDQGAAIELAADALALATASGEPIWAAETAFNLGNALLTSGRFVEARLAYEFGRELSAPPDLALQRAKHEFGLARVASRDEALETAAAHLDEAERLARRGAGDWLLTAIELERTLIAYRRVRFVEARQRLDAALERAQRAGDWSVVGVCRSTRGLLRRDWDHDLEGAERDLTAAVVAFENAGQPVNALGASWQRLDVEHRRAAERNGTTARPARDFATLHARDLEALLRRSRELRTPWIEASVLLTRAEWEAAAGAEDAALDSAVESERVFAEHVGSAEGALRARRLQAGVRLRRGDVEFASQVLDRALAYFTARERSRDPVDAVGDRVNAEHWCRLAIDVAAARVRAGGDAAREFVRCAPWRDRALFLAMPTTSGTDEAAALFVARAWPSTTRFVDFARGSESLYAFVAGAEGVRLIEVGPWHELEARTSSYTALVRDPMTSASRFAKDGHALFTELLAPALEGDGIRHVVVSPGETLAVLPFDALCTRSSPERVAMSELPFAVRSYRIDLVPSWRSCVEAAVPVAHDGAPRLLVVGDPRPTPLPTLPGAAREARGIAELARDVYGDAAQIDVLIGEEATKTRVLDALGDADVLHIAAHADIDWSDPARTGVWLAGNERLSLGDLGTRRIRARLTVLSACASAHGHRLAGSGVLSLASAFLVAGSRGVIATRFPVDDGSAELFQRRFYRAMWQQDATAPDALRAAKLEFLEGTASGDLQDPRGGPAISADDPPPNTTAHPSHWAAYVYSGAEP